MNKKFSALLAAILVTGFIALVMTVTSVNALMNQSGTAVSNDPAIVSGTSSQTQAQIDQLTARVNEYQQREAQYQQLLQTDQAQIQQYKQFIVSLQQAGVIRINNDGTVNVSRSGDGD
jgi:peptidoglycan hydrolase CwlO-like protein